MKRSDFDEKEPVYYISKWLVIIAIIITSSVSFTLGFFVGKNISITEYQQPPLSQEGESFQQNVYTEQTIAPAEPSTSESQEEINSSETIDNYQKKQNGQNLKAGGIQQQATNTMKTEPIKENGKTKSNTTGEKISPVIRYTVQAGAFKNLTEAESLKETLEKKGYKPSITLSETINHAKIYKVRIGEFKTRKEANILSLKIKKSEGLNTFVTFK